MLGPSMQDTGGSEVLLVTAECSWPKGGTPRPGPQGLWEGDLASGRDEGRGHFSKLESLGHLGCLLGCLIRREVWVQVTRAEKDLVDEMVPRSHSSEGEAEAQRNGFSRGHKPIRLFTKYLPGVLPVPGAVPGAAGTRVDRAGDRPRMTSINE